MPRAPEVARAGAQILERLGARLGVPTGIDPISLDMAQFYWYLDASRAESELGFSPRDPVETLADTVRDLEERGVVWPSGSWPGAASSLVSTLRKVASARDDDRPKASVARQSRIDDDDRREHGST
jgi:dihydroflavonol-4-reductase